MLSTSDSKKTANNEGRWNERNPQEAYDDQLFIILPRRVTFWMEYAILDLRLRFDALYLWLYVNVTQGGGYMSYDFKHSLLFVVIKRQAYTSI